MDIEEDIDANEDKLLTVEADEAKIRAKTSHQAFTDAKRVILLADEEDSLDRTLRHERERQANAEE